MKAATENQFFHLTFGQYVGLNQRPAIKDLVTLIRNEDTYETFRAELLRQPVEHEDDASFLAGLKEIPQALLDAAMIDGANLWHRLRYVTLPLLTPTISEMQTLLPSPR